MDELLVRRRQQMIPKTLRGAPRLLCVTSRSNFYTEIRGGGAEVHRDIFEILIHLSFLSSLSEAILIVLIYLFTIYYLLGICVIGISIFSMIGKLPLF